MATSGAQLLPTNAVSTLCEKLLPISTVITPNVPEARLLLKNFAKDQPHPESLDDLIQDAKALRALGPRWVLLKGGHFPLTRERKVAKEEPDRQLVVNVLVGDEVTLIESEYQRSRNTHGTGCSLACKSWVHQGFTHILIYWKLLLLRTSHLAMICQMPYGRHVVT